MFVIEAATLHALKREHSARKRRKVQFIHPPLCHVTVRPVGPLLPSGAVHAVPSIEIRSPRSKSIAEKKVQHSRFVKF